MRRASLLFNAYCDESHEYRQISFDSIGRRSHKFGGTQKQRRLSLFLISNNIQTSSTLSNAKLNIVTVVWGPAYVGPFLSIALPSLLSPGNLPTLARSTTVQLQIFTSSDDYNQISAHPAIHKARRYADVRFFKIASTDKIKKVHKYLLHTAILQEAMAIAKPEAADLMIFSPDFIISDGSLISFRDALGGRYGIVLFPSIRTTKFAFLSDLLSVYGREIDHAHSLMISSRELAAFALQHLHLLVLSAIVSSGKGDETFCRSPLFYWPVTDAGLLVRSFVWSPLYVRPREWPQTLLPTVDFQDFPSACGIERNELVHATDSDEMLVVEFSDYTADFYQIERCFATTDGVVDWIGRLGMPHHLENLNFSYVMRSADIAAALACDAEAKARQTATQILERTLPLIEFQLAPKLCNQLSYEPKNRSSIGGVNGLARRK